MPAGERIPSSLADDFVRRLLALSAARVLDRELRMERCALLLAEIGPLPAGIPLIKVTGTNGKGSVAALLDACLGAAGKRVGLFTSPHLERVTERLRIGGTEIASADFARHLEEVERAVGRLLRRHGARYTPSFFEALLLVSLRAFRAARVDALVYEAGIGGAHDPISLLPGPLSILTTVALDHEDELGHSRIQIAREKAGIADPGSTLVLGPAVRGQVQRTVARVTRARAVRLVRARRDLLACRQSGEAGSVVEVRHGGGGGGSIVVHLPLAGDFQLDNLASAVAALGELEAAGIVACNAACLRGVEAACWPSRLQHVAGTPDWLLDGAHNDEAIAALAGAVAARFGARSRLLVFGTAARKSYRRYLHRLPSIAPEVWVTDDFDGAEDRTIVTAALAGTMAVGGSSHSLPELLERLLARPGARESLVIVAGSLYLAGNVRRWLANRPTPAIIGSRPRGGDGPPC
jgi:dihydrofolate synthase/folylpolyglutamate synthase